MSRTKITCSRLKWCFKQNVNSVNENAIIMIIGKILNEMQILNQAEFIQSTNNINGNNAIKQEINVFLHEDDLDDVLAFKQSDLILVLYKSNGEKAIWGDKENPIQVDITQKDSILEIRFYRIDYKYVAFGSPTITEPSLWDDIYSASSVVMLLNSAFSGRIGFDVNGIDTLNLTIEYNRITIEEEIDVSLNQTYLYEAELQTGVGSYLKISGDVNLIYLLAIQDHNITRFKIPSGLNKLDAVYLNPNGIIVDDINDLISKLDAEGLLNGNVNISGSAGEYGTNAIPSGSGLTSKNNLISKSWSFSDNS